MKRAEYRRLNIKDILARYGNSAAMAAKKALLENAEALAEEAKRRCPVDTGQLKESIHVEMSKSGTKAKVIADAVNLKGHPYARYVEFSPRIDEPFMYPAMESKREEMKQNTINKIREALGNDRY